MRYHKVKSHPRKGVKGHFHSVREYKRAGTTSNTQDDLVHPQKLEALRKANLTQKAETTPENKTSIVKKMRSVFFPPKTYIYSRPEHDNPFRVKLVTRINTATKEGKIVAKTQRKIGSFFLTKGTQHLPVGPGMKLESIPQQYQKGQPQINLAGANLKEAEATSARIGSLNLAEANLSGANFTYARIHSSNFAYANLSGADFINTKIEHSDLTGADLTGADLTGAIFGETNLKGVNWKGAKTDNMSFYMLSAGPLGVAHGRPQQLAPSTYDQYTFEQTVKALNITENQLEFLVTSGVLEVRENRTLSVVTKGFDPNMHHIPAWVVQNADFATDTKN